MNKLLLLVLGLLLIPSIEALCWDLDSGTYGVSSSSSFGGNPFMRGSTYVGDYFFGFFQFVDSCNPVTGVVTEYYCTNLSAEIPASYNYTCPRGCTSVFYHSLYDFYQNESLEINASLGYCRWTGGGSESVLTSVSSSVISCVNGFNAFGQCISYGSSCEEGVCEPLCESQNGACFVGCHNYCNKKCSYETAALSCSDSDYEFVVLL